MIIFENQLSPVAGNPVRAGLKPRAGLRCPAKPGTKPNSLTGNGRWMSFTSSDRAHNDDFFSDLLRKEIL
jgi:hypothetical protein